MLVGGLVLIAVSRLSGLVLPTSTKYLIDDVIGKSRSDLLLPLVLAVVAATIVQGASSFALTQLLSKEAQRPHRRHAPARAGPHRPAAGRLLRREQDGARSSTAS
jgi:hypothetical protein